MPRPIQEVTSIAAPAVTVLHGGALGDFVLAVQWLRRLRVGDAPHGRSIVARAQMSALPARVLALDGVVDADTLQLHRIFAADAPLLDALADRLKASILVIDMITRGDATAVARLRGVAGGAVVTIDPAPIPGDKRHVTEQWMARVREAGAHVSVEDSIASLTTFRNERGTQKTSASPIALLHPGSGGRAKCWPVERFVALAQRLIAVGVAVQFVVGPTERDWHGKPWTERLSAVAPLIAEADLLPLAERIAAADLYVGNDAGGTHLAAATGTPTLALFGPTEQAVWRPIGRAVRVLTSPSAAMDDLPLDRVFDACMDMISKHATTAT